MKLEGLERVVWSLLRRLLPADERHEFLADLLEEAEGAETGVRQDRRWIRRQLLGSIPPAFGRAGGAALRGAATDGVLALQSLRGGRGGSVLLVCVVGVGLATAAVVFSVMKAVLLEPLPYPDPESLHVLKTVQVGRSPEPRGVSGPDYYDYEEAVGDRIRFGVFAANVATLTNAGGPALRVDVSAVNRAALEITGATPLLGRIFSDDEDGPEPGRVTIISEALWQDHFAGSLDVLGRSISLDGEPHVVVGVLPAGFLLPNDRIQLWTPLGDMPRGLHRRAPVLDVVFRLAGEPGAGGLQEQLAGVADRLAREYPETNARRSVRIVPLVRDLAGQDGRTLPVLMAMSLCMLGLAFLNGFGLLFARTTRRTPEFELRRALGAGGGRVARQLMLEVAVQVTLGLGLSVALSAAALRLGSRIWPPDLFRAEAIHLDGPVLVFLVLAACVMGALVALSVAWASRSNAGVARARSARSELRSRVRLSILSLQVAGAVGLVLGAAVLVRGLAATLTIDRGVSHDQLLVANVNLPATRYPTGMARYPDWPEIRRFYADLHERMAMHPAVESAAIAGSEPLRQPTFRMAVGLRTTGGIDTTAAVVQSVSPEWRQVVELGLVHGRDLAPSDTRLTEAVVLVNESFWRILLDRAPGPWGTVEYLGAERRIVGVIEDAIPAPGTTAQPTVFAPLSQAPSEWLSIIVRTRGDPERSVGMIRDMVAELDPEVAVHGEAPLSSIVGRSIARPRLHAGLVSSFTSIALLLATIGLFALLTETVNTRRREIGVRLALGARPGAIVSSVLREAAFAVALGTVFGCAAVWSGLEPLRRLVPDTPSLEAVPAAVAAAVLLIAGALASLAPVLRALGTDPMRSLKAD